MAKAMPVQLYLCESAANDDEPFFYKFDLSNYENSRGAAIGGPRLQLNQSSHHAADKSWLAAGLESFDESEKTPKTVPLMSNPIIA